MSNFANPHPVKAFHTVILKPPPGCYLREEYYKTRILGGNPEKIEEIKHTIRQRIGYLTTHWPIGGAKRDALIEQMCDPGDEEWVPAFGDHRHLLLGEFQSFYRIDPATKFAVFDAAVTACLREDFISALDKVCKEWADSTFISRRLIMQSLIGLPLPHFSGSGMYEVLKSRSSLRYISEDTWAMPRYFKIWLFHIKVSNNVVWPPWLLERHTLERHHLEDIKNACANIARPE